MSKKSKNPNEAPLAQQSTNKTNSVDQYHNHIMDAYSWNKRQKEETEKNPISIELHYSNRRSSKNRNTSSVSGFFKIIS